MMYGSELNELHSCPLHLDRLNYANCDQTTSLAFNKNIGNCNIIGTSVKALTETKKDKKSQNQSAPKFLLQISQTEVEKSC